jgi:hypothetical protein
MLRTLSAILVLAGTIGVAVVPAKAQLLHTDTRVGGSWLQLEDGEKVYVEPYTERQYFERKRLPNTLNEDGTEDMGVVVDVPLKLNR